MASPELKAIDFGKRNPYQGYNGLIPDRKPAPIRFGQDIQWIPFAGTGHRFVTPDGDVFVRYDYRDNPPRKTLGERFSDLLTRIGDSLRQYPYQGPAAGIYSR